MAEKLIFETVSRTLRDLMKAVYPALESVHFSGIPVVFGGDLRQVLPVIKRGGRPAIVAAMLRNSSILWPLVQQLKLTINKRVTRLQGQDQQQQAAFADYLLQVGEGREPTFPDIGQDIVRLEDSMCLPCDSGVSALVQRVYDDMQRCSDPDFLMERSILALRNIDVEGINSYILQRWAGQVCHAQLSRHHAAQYPAWNVIVVLYEASRMHHAVDMAHCSLSARGTAS